MAAWLILSAAAAVDSDPRMQVDVAKRDLPSQSPNLNAVIRAAAPALWDRLLLRRERGPGPLPAVGVGLVTRIRPTPDGYRVEFNREAVFHALEEAGAAYLRRPPRMQVLVRLVSL